MWLPAFVEMLSALSDAGADYLVVGGYAVGVHLVPRATKDIDLLVRPTAANARRVLQALERFGAPRFGLTAADLARPGLVFQIGVPPFRIDILTSIASVDFDEAWQGHIEVAVPGVAAPVPVIGREALLRNKRAVGRPQDLADVAMMERGAAPERKPKKPARRRRRR